MCLRIQDKLDLAPDERVTSALQRAMTRGEDELFVDIKQILDEHNLNFDTFSYFYIPRYQSLLESWQHSLH